MAKQIFLDRQRAMVQWFRWAEIFRVMDQEAEKEFPRTLDQVVADLNAQWKREFEKHCVGYKRKPKFRRVDFA